jgi:hypothetical protein
MEDAENASRGAADRSTRIHLEDVQERISNILED